MPRKRSAKVILDTNWYISASINRKSRRTLYDILTNPSFEIFYSKELVQNFRMLSAAQSFEK